MNGSAVNDRIARGLADRRLSRTVTVVGADGRPAADTEVVVEQRSHAFGFGNIGFDLIPLANGEPFPEGSDGPVDLERLGEQFLGVFNQATLPFYWGRFEPERGAPDTERFMRAAQWFADRGVTVKGHPLVWHTVTAPWLLELPVDEIERVQRERVRRDVAAFAGVVDVWDAINEAVIMPVFENGDNGITKLAQSIGQLPMIRLAFEEARAANPSATLLINDFDLSPAYERLIEQVLEAGIQVDAIGLQTHMHQGYRGEQQILEIADRFARFGLPLHFTESTLLSGEIMPPHIEDLNDYVVDSWPSTPEGEARQADEIVRHYRSLVSHPAVEVINYWGITDHDAWLGAPVGLVRADGTEKPSYGALRDLIMGEWWHAPITLRTDAEGRVRVDGFAGEYAVTSAGHSGTFALTKDAGAGAGAGTEVRLG